MILALLLLTLCLHAVACPRWLTRVWVVTCGGAATRLRSLAPYRTRPVPETVGKAAVPAPTPPPPLGRPRGPDPQPGRRVSIRPQPTRAPQDEVMALGPLRGREPARAVARGPTLEWAGGGMAGGTAAAALRLPLAPGDRDGGQRSPPPRGAEVSKGLTGNVRRLTGEQGGRGAQQLKVAASPRPSLPTPAPNPTEALTVERASSEFRPAGEPWGRGGHRPRAAAGPNPRPHVPAPTPTEAPAMAPRTDPPPDSIPVAPRDDGGGSGGGLGTTGLPPGMGPEHGPSKRQEGVYTPTAHKGAPRRGDGSRPLLAGGLHPAVAGGPTLAWGGRGMAWDLAAAALRLSLALGAAGGVSWDIPPLPPLHKNER